MQYFDGREDGTHLRVICVLSKTMCKQFVHLVYSLHLEAGAVFVQEPQLSVYIPIRTVVDDEELHLFKVSFGGKWGLAIFWFGAG